MSSIPIARISVYRPWARGSTASSAPVITRICSVEGTDVSVQWSVIATTSKPAHAWCNTCASGVSSPSVADVCVCNAVFSHAPSASNGLEPGIGTPWGGSWRHATRSGAPSGTPTLAGCPDSHDRAARFGSGKRSPAGMTALAMSPYGGRTVSPGARMPQTLFGLPTHILLLHVVVVMLPVSAVVAIAVALVPGFRHRYGLGVVVFTFVTTLFVPLTS